MYSRMATIILKVCSVCGLAKPLCDFYLDRGNPRNDCKKCNCQSRKDWQKQNISKVLQKNKRWREKNEEHYKAWQLQYAPIRRENRRRKYSETPQLRKKTILFSRAYRADPKNRNKIRATAKRLRKKYALNPMWNLINNLRRRLRYCLHGKRKEKNTMSLIGCSSKTLRQHIETQFMNGMTWENYGQWHVDHIIPCSAFDFSKPGEQEKCFHYTNLQPLWAKDNLIKGDSRTSTK